MSVGEPIIRSRFRRFLAGLGLVLFSTFLAVGLSEVAVRILAPLDVPWQRHEILGHSHVPGKKGIYRGKGFSTPFRFNSHGWRDKEYPFEKPEGTFRIIVLGDSFTEGLQIPVEDIFTELVEARLGQRRTRSFEVINMGVGAFSTDQQYLAFKHYGMRYHPDLVILVFCVENDIYGNLPELGGDPHKPHFFIDDSGRLVQGEFELPQEEGVRTFLRNHFQLYMFLRNRLSTMNRLASLLLRLGILRNTNYVQRDEHGVFIDYLTHQAHYTPEWQRAWEVTKALLLAIRDEASRSNTDFLLVLSNYNVVVHDDLWEEALETYPSMAEVEWDLGKANRLINDFCGLNHMRCLDLLPEFREKAARGGEPLYLPGDGHWNRKGHELAAELIYKKIVATQMIPLD